MFVFLCILTQKLLSRFQKFFHHRPHTHQLIKVFAKATVPGQKLCMVVRGWSVFALDPLIQHKPNRCHKFPASSRDF